MRILKFFAVVLVSAAVSACASMGTPDAPHAQQFSAMAASGDRFEIASSRLALNKSRNGEVRSIAKKMIADHSKSSKEMTELLANGGLPAPPPGLSPQHQQQFEKLSNSLDFDRDYLDAQARAHRGAITLFKTYSEGGDHPALRNFAAKTLPTIQMHYRMIEQARGGCEGANCAD